MKTSFAIPVLLASLLALPYLGGAAEGDAEYGESVRLIREAKYPVAATLLKALQEEDDRPRVRYALGFCEEKQGNEAVAVDHYKVALVLNINTSPDPDDAERAMKRLDALQPHMEAVLKRAWELESLARKAEGAEQQYLMQASKTLYQYALDAKNWDEAKLQDTPANDIELEAASGLPPVDEDTLGYKLGRHKIGARKWNGHWYLLVEGQISWDAARKQCQAMGGYLATITSRDEYEYLKKLADPPAEEPSNKIWLGGKVAGSGHISWITGEPAPSRDALERRYHVGAYLTLRAEDEIIGIRENGKNGKGRPLIKGFICEWDE